MVLENVSGSEILCYSFTAADFLLLQKAEVLTKRLLAVNENRSWSLGHYLIHGKMNKNKQMISERKKYFLVYATLPIPSWNILPFQTE